MRKRKLVICTLCMILILLLQACGMNGNNKYACELTEVKEIQIIRFDGYVENEYKFKYTVLSQVSDIETFVDRLNKIEHFVIGGSPLPCYEGVTMIRVEYMNGDYDALGREAQIIYSSDKGRWGYGHFYFDKEQFEALINDYLNS